MKKITSTNANPSIKTLPQIESSVRVLREAFGTPKELLLFLMECMDWTHNYALDKIENRKKDKFFNVYVWMDNVAIPWVGASSGESEIEILTKGIEEVYSCFGSEGQEQLFAGILSAFAHDQEEGVSDPVWVRKYMIGLKAMADVANHLSEMNVEDFFKMHVSVRDASEGHGGSLEKAA